MFIGLLVTAAVFNEVHKKTKKIKKIKLKL